MDFDDVLLRLLGKTVDMQSLDGLLIRRQTPLRRRFEDNSSASENQYNRNEEGFVVKPNWKPLEAICLVNRELKVLTCVITKLWFDFEYFNL